MINKLKSMKDIHTYFKDGMSILFGGFLGAGGPDAIIKQILDSGVKNLTIIGNDTTKPDFGIGTLIVNKRVSKIITSHIGTNPETGRQMMAGETEVILTPQGTLAEQIRCGGAGLGGFLTPTGIGTIVEEGKQIIEIDGKKFILELPIRADLAIIKAHKADKLGNLVYRRAARNFNPLMALAADFVIAEYEELYEVGQLDPDMVMTPGMLVNVLVSSQEA